MLHEQLNLWGSYFVWNWLDALWIPVALLIVHKSQKIKAAAFVVLCMTVLRLQIEIIEGFKLERSITGLFDYPLIFKGYVAYGLFFALYLLLSYLSPYTRGAIYLAATLSIFFMAFTVSTVVLIF